MALTIKKMTNANVYLDGNSLLGKAEEISLPDLSGKMVEHKALGMVGTTEFWAGLEKMESKIKWNSMYPDVMKKSANPVKAWKLQLRSSLEEHTSEGRIAQDPVVCFMTGTFKKQPGGNFKQHDNVELESMVNVSYIKLEIKGEVIYEVDVLANIFIVAGEDILTQYRSNLGI
jgi:P2 family phage contractile tail tube protein